MYNTSTIFGCFCSVVYRLIAIEVIMLVGAIVWGQVAWHHDDLLGYSRARKFSLYMVILVLGGICIVYILK